MIEARLHALLRGVPVAMLVVDRQARIMGANEPAEALLGPVPGGRPFVTVLRQPEVNAALDGVLAGQQDRAQLSLALGAAERRVFCAVTVTRLDAPGLAGATVAIEDRSRDEETEQMRRDFVANVSHELRTPLTALMGFIETLRGPARNDEAARTRFLDIMEREAGRMNRLVADLLSLSRVEQDERRRPAQSLDLAALLRGVVAMLRVRGWRAANIDSVVVCERPKLGPHIDAMRTLLASDLGIDMGAVGVKATTSEKLGFTGREEGIAAQAVALIERLP